MAADEHRLQAEVLPADQPPSAPLPPYRSSARRARVVTWLLAVATILGAAAAVADVYGIGLVRQAIDGSLTDQEAKRFVDVSTTISVAYLLASLAAAVAFLAWLSRAVENVPALGAGRPSASPRWAIAWWFIPFANLGMPYEVVRELRGRMRREGRRKHPPLLLAWWFTFVGGEVLLAATARMPGDTVEQVSASLTVATIGLALTVSAGVLAILVIRGIERTAVARAATRESGAALLPEGSPDDWDAGVRRTGWRMRASWVGYVAIPAALVVGIAVPLLVRSPSVATLQHEAPELEAGLPDAVSGHALERWSLRGEDYFVVFVGLGADQLAKVKADLAQTGVAVDDVALAVAWRADAQDPPYVIFAFQIRGIGANTLPDGTLLDHPEAGTFTAESIAGKSVRRGTVEMFEQSDNARGIPYLYDFGQVRYILVTDDEDWAFDALGKLP